MSHLHPGDDTMHHCDTSHRWIAPPEFDQQVWAAQVRAHMQEHLATMGGDPRRQRQPRLPEVHVADVVRDHIIGSWDQRPQGERQVRYPGARRVGLPDRRYARRPRPKPADR